MIEETYLDWFLYNTLPQRIVDLLPRHVNFWTYSALTSDLLGAALPGHGLIAIHNSLAESKVALFHEAAEYLLNSGLLRLEVEGNSLVILRAKWLGRLFARFGRSHNFFEVMQRVELGADTAAWLQRKLAENPERHPVRVPQG